MTRLQKYFITVWIVTVFHVIDITLRVWGFDRVFKFLVEQGRRDLGGMPPTAVGELIEVVQQAARKVRQFDYRSRPDCLPRALATYYILFRYGVAVEFAIGVKAFPFGAHAWVEYQGRVISDYEEERSQYMALMKAPSC